MPRRADEYLKQLAKVPMFRALSKRDLALVKRNAESHRIPAGDDLVKEGGRGHEFFIIVEGRATIRRKGKKIGNVGPGDYFGELAVLDPAERDATVTATADTELLVISGQAVTGLVADVPGFGRRLLAGLARRLRSLDETID